MADVLLLADLSRWPIIYSVETDGTTYEILAFVGDDESDGWANRQTLRERYNWTNDCAYLQ